MNNAAMDTTCKYSVYCADMPEIEIRIRNCPRAMDLACELAKALASSTPGVAVRVIRSSDGRAMHTYVGEAVTRVEARRH